MSADRQERKKKNAAIAALMRYDLFSAKQDKAGATSFEKLAELYGFVQKDTRKTEAKKRVTYLKYFLDGKQGGSDYGEGETEAKTLYDELLECVQKYWHPKIKEEAERTPREARFPDFVPSAYNQAYPTVYRTEEGQEIAVQDILQFIRKGIPSKRTQKLGSIFWKIGYLLEKAASDAQEGTRTKLKLMSEKVFDVYRWTGPSSFTLPGEEGGETNRPRAIRAALKFSKHPLSQEAIHFRLRYRPIAKNDARFAVTDVNECTGYAVPVGQYVLFIGVEEGSTSPVFILCDFGGPTVSKFSGLVVRRSDSDTNYFAARVFFLEHESDTQFDHLDEEIRIVHEWEFDDALEEKVVDLLNQTFKNSAELDGKQALVLRRI